MVSHHYPRMLKRRQATVLNLAQMGMKDIWAKANSPQHGRIAERVGAHHVIYPEAGMGERVAHLTT